MPDSIFSTYRTGENRVTASILAVLRSLALRRTERLLGALMERSEFELVSFQNQTSKGGKGVPDASITASCRLLVETKIERNAVRRDQIQRHLERLSAAQEAVKVLLVLTPDDTSPAALSELGDPRIAWASFAALDQAIEELLKDPSEVVSEREAFLLRELQAMLAEEELISAANDVVVVPARNAWPEYREFHAYVCQPKRPFQGVRRMAFYTAGAIQTSRSPQSWRLGTRCLTYSINTDDDQYMIYIERSANKWKFLPEYFSFFLMDEKGKPEFYRFRRDVINLAATTGSMIRRARSSANSTASCSPSAASGRARSRTATPASAC